MARRLLALLLPLAIMPRPLAAQEGVWSLELGVERARVALGSRDVTWGEEHLQLDRTAPGRGSVFLGLELQRRDGDTDTVVTGGGYRRLGPWTLAAQAGASPRASFYYRAMGEGELVRILRSGLAASGSYRYLGFRRGNAVHLLSPGLTWSGARGELHGRLILVRDRTFNRKAESFLLRGYRELGRSFRLSAGAAAGGGIFDVTSLERGAPRGWVFWLSPQWRGGRSSLGASLSLAREEPSFEKRSLSVYYRRTF
jgi:YaiO family outer membrane protein